jgi:multicomponent K+:H+ antiporter subunit E
MSATLWLVWPVLNQSWSLGQMLLGLLLAWAIPWLLQHLRQESARPRRPFTVARLGLTVLKDIISSNLDVARLILGREDAIRSGFFWVPLSIIDPHGIVALAGIITLTPGTVSADLSDDRRLLLVHALHCPNDESAAALVADIQARYEAPLKEIFE